VAVFGVSLLVAFLIDMRVRAARRKDARAAQSDEADDRG